MSLSRTSWLMINGFGVRHQGPLALTQSATYPLTLEIDNVTNYVSTVPLRELGLGLGEEPLSDEQAQELTDDYSLPALKVSDP